MKENMALGLIILTISTAVLWIAGDLRGDEVPENRVVRHKGGYMVFIKTDIEQEHLERLLEIHIYPETQRGEE